jgi:DNA invertase Pin-like site-specific DNA recombinase
VKRAVIYIRKRGRSPTTGIPLQRRQCLDLARRLGAEVVGEFVDPSASANQVDRPGLKRMLRRLTGRDIAYVVVQSFDRLARRLPDGEKIRRAIERSGAKLELADGSGSNLAADFLKAFKPGH